MRWIIGFVSHRQDNGADVDLPSSWPVVIFYGLSKTDLFTEATPHTSIPINGVCQRDSLGIFDVCGCPVIQTAVKLIDGCNGAQLAALAAPGALVRINEPRVVYEGCPEMTGLALEGF
jgi:hypothetical protein